MSDENAMSEKVKEPFDIETALTFCMHFNIASNFHYDLLNSFTKTLMRNYFLVVFDVYQAT